MKRMTQHIVGQNRCYAIIAVAELQRNCIGVGEQPWLVENEADSSRWRRKMALCSVAAKCLRVWIMDSSCCDHANPIRGISNSNRSITVPADLAKAVLSARMSICALFDTYMLYGYNEYKRLFVPAGYNQYALRDPPAGGFHGGIL